MNFTIPCYVLDDGTRILSGRGMQEALKMVDEATKVAEYLRKNLGWNV